MGDFNGLMGEFSLKKTITTQPNPLTTDQKVRGSSPLGRTLSIKHLRKVPLTREKVIDLILT